MVEKKPKRPRKLNAGVEIRDATVVMQGGDIAGRDIIKNYHLTLGGPPQQRTRPMMAPEPPADFVQRPEEFIALKHKRLEAKGDSVAITAALRGAGGYGKTTLAKALAHDAEIQKAYSDGILWATLGEKPESLLLILSDLVIRLTGAQPGLNTMNAAASALGDALGDRRILLVPRHSDYDSLDVTG